MTSITIDNIDDDLMRRLREQAERTGNSVADEAKSFAEFDRCVFG